MNSVKVSLIALCVVSLFGCGGRVKPDEQTTPDAISQKANKMLQEPVVKSTQPMVFEHEQAYIPTKKVDVQRSNWLKGKQISIKVSSAVSLNELVKVFAKEGITIVSEMSLDQYSYSGFSLTKVDPEVALRTILGSTGLDYQLDTAKNIVIIKPLASKTWYMNLGNRKSSFVAGGNATNSTVGGTSSSMANTGMSGGMSNSSMGGMAGSSTSQVSSGLASSGGSGSIALNATDDFWSSLSKELDTRLKVLVPNGNGKGGAIELPPAMVQAGSNGLSAQALPPPLPGSGSGQSGGVGGNVSYASVQIGTYSLNPETGSITVQAPHWVISSLDTYFKRIQDMYNTDITFTGELVILSLDKSRSEGLDLSALGSYMNNRFGWMYRNNALGGITISNGNMNATNWQAPSVTFNSQSPLAPITMGVVSEADKLMAFNNYLQSLGTVNIIQKPIITTTSGMPADFKRTMLKYFNTVSQQAASGGTGSAAVGTQNILVPIEMGTILKINPRIDISTGLIRSQISLEQITQSGVQNVTQSLTSGNSVQQFNTPIPILSKISYSGEALLKNGDLIILGGQAEDSVNTTINGVPGLMDMPGTDVVFSNKSRQNGHNIFYFALKVNVNKRQ